MSTLWLAEKTVDLIQSAVQTNIASALGAVVSLRGDGYVSAEAPSTQSYFIYGAAKAFRAPAIFTIIDSFDLRNIDRGSNFISANASIMVSVVVEDRDLKRLTHKAFRYQAALHSILHLTSLTSVDSKVRLESRVARVLFSPEYTDAQSKDVPPGVFRKEVALHLDVEHYEGL
jgi:hypothetical protein